MTDRQRALLKKADRALRTAAGTLQQGDAEAAINRAYYAAFYAATAALLLAGEAPRTHSGVHRRFHLHYVASGQIPSELGQILLHASALRQRADYEAFAVFDEGAAADLIEDVSTFVQYVEGLLASL